MTYHCICLNDDGKEERSIQVEAESRDKAHRKALAEGMNPVLVIGPVEEAIDLFARMIAEQAVEELRRRRREEQ